MAPSSKRHSSGTLLRGFRSCSPFTNSTNVTQVSTQLLWSGRLSRFRGASQTHFVLKILWSSQNGTCKVAKDCTCHKKWRSKFSSFPFLIFPFLFFTFLIVPFLFFTFFTFFSFLLFSSFLFFAFLFSSLLFLAFRDDSKSPHIRGFSTKLSLTMALGWISSKTSTSYAETPFQTTMFWKTQHGFYPFIGIWIIEFFSGIMFAHWSPATVRFWEKETSRTEQ